MTTKAFVLLSGGIDSSTCLAIAVRDCGEENVKAISIDYGQRHQREIQAAKEVADALHVTHETHQIIGIPKVMLTDPTAEVPNISYQEIQGVSPTYVPFRNGQLISKIAGIAAHEVKLAREKQREDYATGATDIVRNIDGAIYFGAHAEDAANDAYPDCRLDFVGAMAAAVYIGTYHDIRLKAPLIEMYKDEIIYKGTTLNVPYKLTWSCYKGEDLHCGVCPTCRARKAGFLHAGVSDPTEYAS